MKIIKYQPLLFGALLLLSSFSQIHKAYGLKKEKSREKNQAIIFIENAFSLALQKAKAEYKYIFVDAYATWCGPCRQLKNTSFKNTQTAEYFNKNFINLSVDMEKGKGVDLATTWEIQEYPTLLILDFNGKILFRSIGYLDAKQLAAFGKRAYQNQ